MKECDRKYISEQLTHFKVNGVYGDASLKLLLRYENASSD